MSSFKPSAPPMPTSSSSSNPNNYNYDPNYNPNHNHNYPPPAQPYSSSSNTNKYNNYNPNHNHNYPPPAQPYSSSNPNSYNNYNPNPNPNNNYPPPAQSYHVGHQSYNHPPSYSGGQSYGNPFPPGTDPEIIRSFEMVDRDRSGFIDDSELQNALSYGNHRFKLSTVRLLLFLFKNPSQSLPKLGPVEFASLWRCLGEWRAIFEKFDRDRSGKIDTEELKDALYSLGYAVPPSVLQHLISHYDGGSRRKVQLDFDSFVECGMVIKGLTEKFKEKDQQYSGRATFSYDEFMTMVLPFLVAYN